MFKGFVESFSPCFVRSCLGVLSGRSSGVFSCEWVAVVRSGDTVFLWGQRVLAVVDALGVAGCGWVAHASARRWV